MRIVDLIFYAFSKARFPEKKGSIFDAVIFGFCFPVALTVATVIRFACKLCLEKINKEIFAISVVLISFLILIIIYLYFKRSGKGEQIINYYEQTKYNKWYYPFTINVIFILLFIVLFLFANQLADKYLYSYLMLWKKIVLWK